MRFEIYEVSALYESHALSRLALIGEATLSIHELVCSPSQSLTKDLESATSRKKRPGQITVNSEEVGEDNQMVRMIWVMDTPSHPGAYYYRIVREHEGNQTLFPIYESERCDKSPVQWKQAELSIDVLCKSELDRKIAVEVNKDLKGKEPVFIGSAVTSVAELKEKSGMFSMELRKGDVVVGTISIVAFEIVEKSSFLDYVFGGCEISLVIGIDFTKSNGNSADRSSLHHQDGATPNEYIQAITEVGEILQYYDSDKRIPVFGFGAKLPPNFTHISHCFALNGDIFDPEVKGIERVVEVYKQTCKEVTFHGPTMFSPLIHTAASYASADPATQDSPHYFILLILTDGIINDMEQTIHEIVEASELPMSIIIVGVGAENFEMMNFLDADDKPLYSKHSKKFMCRDIVQFVPYREVKESKLELARQVLFEVPHQLLSFMTSKGIKPKVSKNTVGKDAPKLMRASTLTKRIHLPPIYEPSKVSPFESIKEKFLGDMAELGYDPEQVMECIREGLYCAEPQYVIELISAKAPVTPLKSSLRPALRNNNDRRGKHVGKVVRMASDNEELLCRLCHKEPINTVLVECGHRVVCSACVLLLFDKECPLCRRSFGRWVLTHDV